MSDPDGVAVLDMGEGPGRTVFVANLRPVTRPARISGWPGDVKTMTLEPYGVVVLR